MRSAENSRSAFPVTLFLVWLIVESLKSPVLTHAYSPSKYPGSLDRGVVPLPVRNVRPIR